MSHLPVGAAMPPVADIVKYLIFAVVVIAIVLVFLLQGRMHSKLRGRRSLTDAYCRLDQAQ